MATYLLSTSGQVGTNNGISSTNATYATARSSGTLALVENGNVGQSGTWVCQEGFFAWNLTSVSGAVSAAGMVTYFGTNRATNASDELRCWLRDFGSGAIATGDWVAGASLSGLTEVATLAPQPNGSSTSGGSSHPWTMTGMVANITEGAVNRFLFSTKFMEDGTATVSDWDLDDEQEADDFGTAASGGGFHILFLEDDATETAGLAFVGHAGHPYYGAGGNIVLNEPTYAESGDLFVAHFGYKGTAHFTAPASWNEVDDQESGNDTEAGIANGRLDWIIRGGSAPSLTWTRTAGGTAIAMLTAYRLQGGATDISLGQTSVVTAGANSTSVTATGFDTTVDNELIVAALADPDNADFTSMTATDPANLIRVFYFSTTQGSDVAMGAFFGYSATAGATGNFVGTTDVSDRKALLVASFEWLEPVEEVLGEADITEADDTLSASAIAGPPVGSASITEANDTLSATGTIPVVGSASITEADDTSTGSGVVGPVLGTASITEANDTLAATATALVSAAFDVTEAGDTLSATATVLVQAAASITEEGDTLSAEGTVVAEGAIGSAAITEADDTVAAAGTVLVAATANITEIGDVLTATGAIIISGSASITEDDDSLSGAGQNEGYNIGWRKLYIDTSVGI